MCFNIVWQKSWWTRWELNSPHRACKAQSPPRYMRAQEFSTMFGAAGWTWTNHTWFFRPVLYQMSYRGNKFGASERNRTLGLSVISRTLYHWATEANCLARGRGLEPLTNRIKTCCSTNWANPQQNKTGCILTFQITSLMFKMFAVSILKTLVWVAGFEPAASEFLARPSTKLTIYPVNTLFYNTLSACHSVRGYGRVFFNIL
jgi:hypothetical protein